MKNILIVLVMILISSPSFGSDLECKTLSKDNYKNFSMGVGIALGNLYMVGYNDGKNKNIINYDEKYMEKIKKLIVEGCSKNPDSDMITLFREGMRDDFNNPNWGKEKKVVKSEPKLKIDIFFLRWDNYFEKDSIRNCFINNLDIDTKKMIEEKLPELEKLRKEKTSDEHRYGGKVMKKVLGKNWKKIFKPITKKCGE